MTNTRFEYEIFEFLKSLAEDYGKKLALTDLGDNEFIVKVGERERRIRFHSVQKMQEAESLSEPGSDTEHTVHIWEDLWQFHQVKVRSKLRSLFGLTERVHGRETRIVDINNDQLIKFLTDNHLNVPIKAKFKYGLIHANALVAVAAFSKPRPITRNGIHFNSYELLRFCNKLDVTVVGGFTKLLQHFIKAEEPDDIMTYVDADWSDGSFYKQNGFELIEKMAPIKFLLNMNTGVREYPHLVFKEHAAIGNAVLTEQEELEFLQHNDYKVVSNSGSYKYLLLRK